MAAIQCCSLSYEKEQLGQFQYKRTHTGVKQHNNGSILGELTKLWFLSTECVLWGIVFQNVYYIMNDQSKKITCLPWQVSFYSTVSSNTKRTRKIIQKPLWIYRTMKVRGYKANLTSLHSNVRSFKFFENNMFQNKSIHWNLFKLLFKITNGCNVSK